MGANNQAEVLVPGHKGAAVGAAETEETANTMRSAVEKHLSGPGRVGTTATQSEGTGEEAIGRVAGRAAILVGKGDDVSYIGQDDKVRRGDGYGNDGKIVGRWTGTIEKTLPGDALPKCEIYDKCMTVPPSPEEVKQAQGALDKQISGLISPQDKQTLKGMQDSLLNGDIKGFAGTIAGLQGDPERLKAFVDETNRNLDNTHAGMKLAIDKAGNVVVYGNGDKGVEISPLGDTTVRGIQHGADGSITMTGEVLNADGAKVFKGLADDAVNKINNKGGDFDFDRWLERLRRQEPLYHYKRWMPHEKFQIYDMGKDGK